MAEKAVLLAMASADVIERGVGAGALVGALAKMLGGGGGRPDQAQAGGKNGEQLPQALLLYHRW